MAPSVSRIAVLAATILMMVGVPAAAQNSALEEVRIIGSTAELHQLPGSAALIDSEQVRIEFANDINQLLKTIPGIYIREEDGYGLRPNIGIRGATSERSSKVTLMEDGVMIAPAPYSNPSAYYFPTTLRMDSVEVLKGAPLLRHGPQTTGGVINMVSTRIPDSFGGAVNLRYGQNNEQDLLANIGGRSGSFGFLLETVQRRSDGFKDIDGGGRDSGYDIEDYLFKVGWEGDRQSLLFKAQYSHEISDETYLGLSDVDFAAKPNRRYGLSAIDQMNNYHQGYSLHYQLALSERANFTAIAYQNEFSRDWFKLGGGAALVNSANAGDLSAQAILDGEADAQGLKYKYNNRDYLSRGIDLNLDLAWGTHALALGGRLHEDEMDRFQPVDVYDQLAGELLYRSRIEPSGSNNRLEDAQALSLWAVDAWQLRDDLLLNLALRYEDVDSQRRQYSDPARADVPSVRGNSTSEWMPGASLSYELSPQWQVLAGVHRGFSPLGGGAKESEEAETSVNWEAGIRYRGAWFAEAVAFYSDFANKTENCSNANPCSNGALSGAFVTGEAVITGLELQLSRSMRVGRFTMPVDLAYTYTQAQISKDNLAEGIRDGDDLAAVPGNSLSLRVGLESDFGWDNYAVAKFVDEMCVDVGCNQGDDPLQRTESLLVLDLISRYSLNDQAVLFLKFENLLNERAIVSRQPDGARPNKPRTASVGLQWSF
ncbi:MAG: Fe(3+) dicitrate transport protein [Halieaceae bacterium]|jgi:Fe(3+) dicitrate transport protein